MWRRMLNDLKSQNGVRTCFVRMRVCVIIKKRRIHLDCDDSVLLASVLFTKFHTFWPLLLHSANSHEYTVHIWLHTPPHPPSNDNTFSKKNLSSLSRSLKWQGCLFYEVLPIYCLKHPCRKEHFGTLYWYGCCNQVVNIGWSKKCY